MEKELKKKLQTVVKLVDNAMVDPDINITYHIPEVIETSHKYTETEEPYIAVQYIVGDYTRPERKIHLNGTYTMHDAEQIANLVTFSIEQFKSGIDSVEMG